MTIIDALLPLVSVLVGAGITYALNVRARRASEVDSIFHEALSAVAVAIASAHYISRIKWGGSTAAEEEELAKSVGKESTERYLRAVADARAAVARASAYDASLAEFYRADTSAFTARGDELMGRLRAHLR